MAAEKKIKILTLVTVEHIQTTYESIITSISDMGYGVENVAVSLCNWYDERHKVLFNQLNTEKYALSRPSGIKTSYWQTKNIKTELEKSGTGSV